MRRNRVIGRIGEKYLTLRLSDGGSVRLKKTAFSSLKEDIRVVGTFNVVTAISFDAQAIVKTTKSYKDRPRISHDEIERLRRSRWVTRELMQSSHVQLMEDDD